MNDENKIEVAKPKCAAAVALAKLRRGIREPYSQLKHDTALKNLKKAMKVRKEMAKIKSEEKKEKRANKGGSLTLDQLREKLRGNS